MGMKKLAALVMALVLCLCAVSAMAATLVEDGEELIQALKSGVSEIKLDCNIEFGDATCSVEYRTGKDNKKNVFFYVNKDATIDFNGYKILGGNSGNVAVFGLDEGAKLTLKNGAIQTNSDYIAVVDEKSTLNIEEDMTIKATGDGFGIFILNGSTVNVKGTIESAGSYAICGNGYVKDPTTINLLGNAKVSAKTMGIYHPHKGTVNVTDNATLSGNVGVEMRSGTLNVSGNATIMTTGSGAASSVANGSGATTENAAVALSPHSTGNDVIFNLSGNAALIANGDAAAIAAGKTTGQYGASENSVIDANVKGGNVEGDLVIEPDNNKIDLDVTGGTFNRYPGDYIDSDAALVTVGNQEDVAFAVGSASIKELVDEATQGDTKGLSITVISGKVDLVNVPAGVGVAAAPGAEAKVNGVKIEPMSESNPYPEIVSVPEMVDANNKDYKNDLVYAGTGDVVLKSSDSFENFKQAELYYNGKKIGTVTKESPKNPVMQASEGSIKVTVNGDEIAEMYGDYKLVIKSKWGEVSGTFTNKAPNVVVNLPQTGDDSNLLLWASMMVITMVGFVLVSKKTRLN